VNLSDNGLAFLSHEEGLRTTVYQDHAGLDTIGVGHLITPQEKASGTILIGGTPAPYKQGLSLAQVRDLFAQDCAPREAALTGMVVCPLSDNQFAALFSLGFNIGLKNLQASSALHIINGGDWTDLEAHWKLWNHDGGTVDPELVGRRAREWDLWNTA
jgi:lysozyme